MTDAQLQKPESTTDTCSEYGVDSTMSESRASERRSENDYGAWPNDQMEAQNESQENDGSNREQSPDSVELDVERERQRVRLIVQYYINRFFVEWTGVVGMYGRTIVLNRVSLRELMEVKLSSADTVALSKVTSTGAMTFSFIQAIERGHATTYGDMLTSMRTTIRKNESDMGGGAVTSLLGMLLTGGSLGGGIRQEPQLTASEPFDVYTKRFSL